MEPNDLPIPSQKVTSELWLGLYDDFVNLEGQCALLCELLSCLSRRENPLASAGKHGVDLLVTQLTQQMIAFKHQLSSARPDGQVFEQSAL